MAGKNLSPEGHAMKFFKYAVACQLLSVTLSITAAEPLYISNELFPVMLQGSGKLTFFGFHIYDAVFYRSSKTPSTDFALDLRYQKSLLGASIANRAADEMKKIGVPDAQASSWGKEMAGFLPNVEPGQSLTAVYSAKQGTTFMYEGKKIAQVPGAEFAKAFFGIWFDQKTSAPKLRVELLGQGCPPPVLGEGC
jgi:hypothetical protein